MTVSTERFFFKITHEAKTYRSICSEICNVTIYCLLNQCEHIPLNIAHFFSFYLNHIKVLFPLYNYALYIHLLSLSWSNNEMRLLFRNKCTYVLHFPNSSLMLCVAGGCSGRECMSQSVIRDNTLHSVRAWVGALRFNCAPACAFVWK